MHCVLKGQTTDISALENTCETTDDNYVEIPKPLYSSEATSCSPNKPDNQDLLQGLSTGPANGVGTRSSLVADFFEFTFVIFLLEQIQGNGQ